MSVERYSEEQIEEVIKKFKTFMSIVVRTATIDFARKIKGTDDVKEIVFTDLVDRSVSLSMYDSDTFFISEEIEVENLEDFISREPLKAVIKRLSKSEKKILYFAFIEDLTNSEIAKIMNLTEKTIKNKKSIIKSKIKAEMEDLRDENRYEQ